MTDAHPPRPPMRIPSAEQQAFWDEFYGSIAPLDPDTLGESYGFHPIYLYHRRFHYAERFFRDLVDTIRGQNVLTIGGGIDKVALHLARRGNQVVSLDLSTEATRQTALLGARLGLQQRLSVQNADWELADFERDFDVVIFHDSLHHMDCSRAISKVHRALRADGVLFAMEPICPLAFVRSLHERFPFRPYPHVERGEIELTQRELDQIAGLFRRVDLHYFDMLSRESIAYFLAKVWNGSLLRVVSRLDAALLNRLPFLRALSSYVVVRAVK